MPEQVVVICKTCGKASVVRKSDERLILSTKDGKCACGGNKFKEITPEVAAL